MGMTRRIINVAAPLSDEQKKMLDVAEKKGYVYDDDCPELTDEQIEMYMEIVQKKRRSKVKRVVSLRLSNESYEIAKRFGAGYTGVLSRILETALSHPKILSKCL